MNICFERSEYIPAIDALNREVFASSAEAELIDRLRIQASPFVSLIADEAGAVVGHILFTPVSVNRQGLIMGLAPMAVASGYQRQGIGGALVREGLAKCEELGAVGVVVLGHSDYYPKFGFQPASTFGLLCEYEVPDDAFMALELRVGGLGGCQAIVRYHSAFDEL